MFCIVSYLLLYEDTKRDKADSKAYHRVQFLVSDLTYNIEF